MVYPLYELNNHIKSHVMVLGRSLEIYTHKHISVTRSYVVDTLLTVGTARRVACIDNTDDRHKAASGQHWTGALKHILSAHY